MVEVLGVTPGSIAERAGISAGDYIISINGEKVSDVLDYRFYLTEKKVTLSIHRGSKLFDVVIEKPMYSDIGLEFRTFLMDEKHSCRNKCIFCFIDQLPKGMRDSLYFKDDDSRLSFLTGSYVTLTNMSDEDVDRIIKMKTSPINISVQATDPELRVKMLNNKNAGKVLETMRRFADGGIEMNCQVVLCRNINDGAALDKTMRDLSELYPHVTSVSVVPAGLTKFRENLFPLTAYTPEECVRVISQVEAFAGYCLEKYGSRIFFCGDELYIKAKLPLPEEEAYEGYPQLENGVGLIRSMNEEFNDAILDLTEKELCVPRSFSIATGEAAFEFISSLIEKLKEKTDKINCCVYKIRNDFFGESITVAGLITGQDLYNQLKDKQLGDKLFLPHVMLRSDGDLFLDGMSPKELEKKLNIDIEFIKNDGYEFVSKLFGEKT